MIDQIIITSNLSCTEQEFIDYMNSIVIDTSAIDILEPTINTYDKLYNGHKIENPANSDVYYFIEIGGRIFLQNIEPYSIGNKPITLNNVQTIVNNHKKQLIEDFINAEKIRLAIEYFRTK